MRGNQLEFAFGWMASLNSLGLRGGVDSRSDSTREGERCKYGVFEKVLS